MSEMKYKVGDAVRTLVDKDLRGNRLFPKGTIGTITECSDNSNSKYPYKVEAFNDYWYYGDDMLEPAQEDNSGWAMARDIVVRYSDDQLEAIFGDKYNGRAGILANFTESEAREAVERWKSAVLVFGDVIVKDGRRCIITHSSDGGGNYMDGEGNTGYVTPDFVRKLKRTGENLSKELTCLLAALEGKE